MQRDRTGRLPRGRGGRLPRTATLLLAGTALLAAVAAVAQPVSWQVALRAEGWKQLSRAQLEALADHSLFDLREAWVIYIEPDGMHMRIILHQGARKDRGTREVGAGGTVCTRWEQLRAGARVCTSVWHKEGLLMSVLPDGTARAAYTFQRGNPGGL